MGPMELEFRVQESDLVALAAHQIATSPAFHQRIRKMHLGYVLGFSLLAAGTYLAMPVPLSSIGFAVLAAVSLLAYPSFSRWKLRRDLPGLVRRKATPASYASRKLRALLTGLEEITEGLPVEGWVAPSERRGGDGQLHLHRGRRNLLESSSARTNIPRCVRRLHRCCSQVPESLCLTPRWSGRRHGAISWTC